MFRCLAECTPTLDECITFHIMYQSLKPCCILCSMSRSVVQIAVVPPYLIYPSCMVWCECQCGRSVTTCIWYDMIADIIIIKSFYSLWSTGHPRRASRHCGISGPLLFISVSLIMVFKVCRLLAYSTQSQCWGCHLSL